MPSTRPGIKFDERGWCTACQYEEKKDSIDWEVRLKQLEALCDRHRRPTGYDCIVASSGGKDSMWQVFVFKEVMRMNVLLVTVSDNFPQTNAGRHNIMNISERFGCDTLMLKPNLKAEKIAVRYAFEKHLKPTYLIDRLIYSYPLYMAKKLGIPLLVYGENISAEYGGVNDEETPSAMNQITNGVASDIPKQELVDAGIPERELELFDPPTDLSGVEAIYLSYFIRWNSYANYVYAKSNGFVDLRGEWDRTHHAESFDQIDSPAYLVHSFSKYPKFGHAQATDYVSKYIRYGMMTREEGISIVKERDGKLDNRCVREFCEFCGYTIAEFWKIMNSFYNKELFIKDRFGEWVLKEPIG
jgi:N-acetyl sugar amidotransferase